MPFHLESGFRRVDTQPQIKSLKCKNMTLLVWWYCGIYKNTRDATQPLVHIAFRTQVGDGAFSDNIVYRYVSIALLGQLPIGTLCRDNRVIGYAIYRTEDLEVSYDSDSWRYTSFDHTARNNAPPPFPTSIHQITHERDKNWLIEFKRTNESTLLIPCLEYFSRCYGQSGELRRVLMTYRWDDCISRFYAPLGEPEDPEGQVWKIKLKRRMHNGDAIFLGHVKYDAYTRRIAKSIHSSVDTQYTGDSRKPAFAQIGPWYTGPATLRVGGIPFNGGKSFLGLQVLGSTEPTGVDIDRNRENRGCALNPAESDAEGNAWAGAPSSRKQRRPEILDLTCTEEPDSSGDTLELEDPIFVVLGPRRVVRSRRDEQAEDSGSSRRPGNESDTFSAGEPHGDGKGIGRASVKKELALASEGTLRDMWNAMQHLQKIHADIMQSIEWYTPSHGYAEDTDPELVALDPFGEDETINDQPIDSEVRKWPYMDPATCNELRGLLVTRINVAGTYVHIIEIQRRIRKSKDKDGVTVDSEEPFCGLIFILDHQDHFETWLTLVRSRVRVEKGVVHRLTKHCPGKADSFMHVKSSKDEVMYWSALKNALKKVDIQLD